ncbi:hypothetical protein PRIC1_007291 [Phytophthora ramorum]|nr:hypothetical protein KRP22_7602 [Phytophthora ramorum]
MLSEPYRLSDSQKIIFVNCYKAARNEERPVDYVRMSKTCHFSTFCNHAQMLAAMEKDIVVELREALMELRAIEAGRRVRTTAEWEDELARVQTLHQEQVGSMEGQVEKLTEDLVNAERENSDLMTQLAGKEKENQRLRLKIRTTASYLQRLAVRNQP